MTPVERRWVAVEHRVLDAPLSGTDFAVWLALADRRDRRRADAEVYTSRATVMAKLGRAGKDPAAVTRATARLEKAGLLHRRVTMRSSKSRVFYSFPMEPRPYLRLDAGLLPLLMSAHLSPEQLLWLTRWQRECGESGWTHNSVSDVAETYGTSARIVQRHRVSLVGLGLLQEEARAGRSSRTSTLDSWVLADLLDSLAPDPWAAAALADDDWPTLPSDDAWTYR